MTTKELVEYYAKLLILQYVGKERAFATIEAVATPVIMPQVSTQEISFSEAPTSGAFVLSYNGVSSASINWNDSAATIQGILQAITGLGSVTVTGAISDLLLEVTFTGVTPPAEILVEESNSLLATATAVQISITETDLTLPLAVQDAFNVTSAPLAAGVQLDVLGKYAGVIRTGYGLGMQITLDDTDFRTLIKFATIKNSAGSSLSDIQSLLHFFFPDQILVFDYKNMQMSYLVSTALGSLNLIVLAINQGLFPKPMAVALALVIYAPVINMFFGFRTYELPAFNSTPFNDYTSYHTDWPWLSYGDAVII